MIKGLTPTLIVQKINIRQNWPYVIIIVLLFFSFLYGWFYDSSKPVAGKGWSDQQVYTSVTKRLATGHLPKPGYLHFSIGYSTLAVPGYHLIPSSPFLAVSYILLIASALLCFRAGKEVIGINWSLFFIFALFYWDGAANSFNYASELFMIPWNNQVIFFAFSFYLWLFVCRIKQYPSLRLVTALGLVSGLCVLTREETVLFVLPATALFLYFSKAKFKIWVIGILLIIAAYIPQLVVKQAMLGSITTSGRGEYSKVTSRYLNPSQLYRNTWETIIDSGHYGDEPVSRKALLQSSPWLLFSPFGIAIVFARNKYEKGLKLFMLLSLILIAFYLSGANMSSSKLKFHCLRYISSGFIALNLGAVIFAKELYDFGSSKLRQASPKASKS